MTDKLCKTCRKPNPSYQCGLCEDYVCKACTQFSGEENFSFLRKIPRELTHNYYCYPCFDDKVGPALESYEETLQQAKEVYVFTKEQSKLTRLLKRTEPPYQVENCEDKEEALLKISFYAVEDKFNALVDVGFKSRKIIIGSHKKTIWDASGVPMNVDPKAIREE
jgi:hypothetical protein